MPTKKQCCTRCYVKYPMTHKYFKKKVDGSYFKRCLQCNALTHVYNNAYNQRRWSKADVGSLQNVSDHAIAQICRDARQTTQYECEPFTYDGREFPTLSK